MAQLRAKQIKLNAGDLVLGNLGSNVLAMPTTSAAPVLTVLGGSVSYQVVNAATASFWYGRSSYFTFHPSISSHQPCDRR